MQVITFNGIRKGVIGTLKKRFPMPKVYGEEIAQGFQEPCFFVKLFPVAQNQVMGRRYKRYHSFDIHYFPESSEGANDEMHDMAEQLYDLLEYLEVEGDLYRGTKMKHEIISGVLHFFVDYDFYVYKKAEEIPLMEQLTINPNTK